MKASNPSTLWAQIFVDELARAGLRAVCIAPGSRSTPLTLAFAHRPDISVYSLLDERGAGFFALGLALASGEPVGLVCTSGTATANFHPAVIEAYHAQVPLLILTADRPQELRHSGANQTIDQVKMYGDHVRWFVDVALPEDNPPPSATRSLRTLACRAIAAAAGLPPGPVHLNFPFRKPLQPATPAQLDQNKALVAQGGRRSGMPFTHIRRGALAPTAAQLDTLAAAIRRASRGLIVCGPRCPAGDFSQAITGLAQVSGYPIFADALSGVRFGPYGHEAAPLILSGYETFLQGDLVSSWETPELILRFGAMPTSKALGDYLETHPECQQIVISGSGTWEEAGHTISDFIWADPETTVRLVADCLDSVQMTPRDGPWLAALRNAEERVWRVFDAIRAERFFEGAILADVVELMPSEGLLYVASSLPVRHLDQFARPRQTFLRVFANRGASGIDGTISSAIGAAAAQDLPLVLVIGDLAFYHDLNGLLALQRCGIKATIVLINNDGGGIFHRLPIAKFDPPFTELFVTPHGLNFEAVVRMFGLDHVQVTSRDTFRNALQNAIGAETSQVIEVPTDSTLHEETRREIVNTVVRRVTAE